MKSKKLQGTRHGFVEQSVVRLVSNEEVRGSKPRRSKLLHSAVAVAATKKKAARWRLALNSKSCHLLKTSDLAAELTPNVILASGLLSCSLMCDNFASRLFHHSTSLSGPPNFPVCTK